MRLFTYLGTYSALAFYLLSIFSCTKINPDAKIDKRLAIIFKNEFKAKYYFDNRR